jgi:hypothetical protein
MAKQQEIKEQLELVEVQFEDNNQKVIFIFLDEEKGEIRNVEFNRQDYNKEKNEWYPSPKKAAEVDKWCEEYFQLGFMELGQAVGERRDIYCYEKFNSFWEVQQISKFDEEMVGQIFETTVVKAFDDGSKISIQFEYEGEVYESKMQYSELVEHKNQWFVNPNKRTKQYEKFKEKFLLPVEDIDQMVGKTIMVEVKKAYGKFIYSEVKPFKKPKKGAAS